MAGPQQRLPALCLGRLLGERRDLYQNLYLHGIQVQNLHDLLLGNLVLELMLGLWSHLLEQQAFRLSCHLESRGQRPQRWRNEVNLLGR